MSKEQKRGRVVISTPSSGREATVIKEADFLGTKFQIYGTSDKPMFRAQDIAQFIGHSDVATMLKNVDEDEKLTQVIFGSGQNRNVWMLTEDGLYEVLMQSRKPIAKQFKKAVKEVLKQIRQTGGYIQAEENDSDADIMAKALMIAQRTIDAKSQRIQMLEGENESLNEEVRLLAPKADYTDKVLQSTNTYTFTQIAKEFGFGGAKSLIADLQAKGIVYRQSKQILLRSRYCGQGYTSTRTAYFTHSDGTMGTNTTTVWTERGRAWLHTRVFDAR